MEDKFTTVTTVGYGSRIIKAIKNFFVAPILIIVAIGLLYWNAGRVDYSSLAKTSIEINPSILESDTALSGKLISATGAITSDESLDDGLFLKADKYVVVGRKVEMYSWVESKKIKNTTNLGGSETTETTYTYQKEWADEIQNSNNFGNPNGHSNPQKALDSLTNKVTIANIGNYSLDTKEMTFPQGHKLVLNSQNILLSSSSVLIGDSYIYLPSGANTYDKPQVGDLRVSYSVLPSGFSGTVFGVLNDKQISPYFDNDNNKFYRALEGTKDQAIATLHTENILIFWIVILMSIIFIWLGLVLLVEPIAVVLDVLPIMGSISRVLLWGTAFIISLVLTAVVATVSAVLHSVIALCVSILVIIIVAIFITKRILKKKSINNVPEQTVV